MPVVRERMSASQFGELMGVLPSRVLGVECDRRQQSVTLVLEPEDAMTQTSGTCPPLSDSTTRRKPAKKGKR